MQRLDNTTLTDFLNTSGTAVILFGAPTGEATMDQAAEFTNAWLHCGDFADFAYVDAFDNVEAARSLGVRVLPTTMIARRGNVIAWIEGRSSSVRIAQAIGEARRERAAA